MLGSKIFFSRISLAVVLSTSLSVFMVGIYRISNASDQPASTAPGASECPRALLGEADSDCPWAAWVRTWATNSHQAIQLPDVISRSLELDSRDAALHEAWGMSENFDVNAQTEIVSMPLLEELARLFGVKLEVQNGRTHQHAGLIHTYGYLLSNLQTPYGYKRTRWVSGIIDRGLGLPAQTLGPAVMGQSTLLSRATALFMRVALHDDLPAWKTWEQRLKGRATQELLSTNLASITRRIEKFTMKSGEAVDLITDFLPFPHDPKAGKLLVYSVRRGGKLRLVTGFPVDAQYSEKAGNPVRPRYNAWLE